MRPFLLDQAPGLAARHLDGVLPRRWTHVRAVAARAVLVAGALPAADRPVLVAAAWLHDVGYAPALAGTGFHPLDGARWLRGRGVDDRVARLVAHHSYARIEADERGLAAALLAEFPVEDSPTADALCYCDMTTGPDGELLDVGGRLAEIRTQYGPGDVVTRFIDRAEDLLVGSVRRTEALLAAATG